MSQEKLKKVQIESIEKPTDIIKLCKENNVPIVISESGDEKVIMMSIDVYGELFYKIQREAIMMGINGLEK